MFRTPSRDALLLIFLAAPAAAQDPDPLAAASVLERDVLTAAVRERNPGLEAIRQAAEAARARAGQAAALAHPMVSYGVAPLSLASDDIPFGQEIEFRQTLPYPGKRRARGAAAEAEAEAAFQDYRDALLELTAEASLRFDDWYLVHRAIEINAQHLRLLDDIREVAASRYAAGLAPQQDPIQAEVESAKLLQLDAELRAEARVVAARINSLLHRRPDLPLPPPPARLPEPEPLSPGGLQEAALAARPDVAGQEAVVRARQAELEMALLERRPDFAVMGSYSSMWMDPEHRWMAGIAVDLPVRRKRIEAARNEAEARLAAARSERAALEDRVRAEIEEALARYHEILHHLQIQRDRLLPATRDQIRAARAGFEAGGSFLAVIEAERNLREAEMREHELLAEAHRRRAVLDQALGGPR